MLNTGQEEVRRKRQSTLIASSFESRGYLKNNPLYTYFLILNSNYLINKVFIYTHVFYIYVLVNILYMKICIIYSKKYIASLYCIYNLYAGTLKLKTFVQSKIKR